MPRKVLTPAERLAVRLTAAYLPRTLLGLAGHLDVTYRQVRWAVGDIADVAVDHGLETAVRQIVGHWHREQPDGTLFQLLHDLGAGLQRSLDVATRIMDAEPSGKPVSGIFEDLATGAARLSLTDAERRAIEDAAIETLVRAGSLFDPADRILRSRRHHQRAA